MIQPPKGATDPSFTQSGIFHQMEFFLRSKRNKDVHVVGRPADSQQCFIFVFDDSGDVLMQTIMGFGENERLAMFRAENNRVMQACE